MDNLSSNDFEDDHVSPISHGEESGSGDPEPGLKGKKVKWFDADRNESYTRIVPFSEKHDTTVEFFYKPVTLSTLGAALAVLAYIATTNDVLEEGRDKQRLGVYAAVGAFLVFSMIHARDGPFIRPHPAFWRIVLGINLLYELGMVFLLFQDLSSARKMMAILDPALNTPLPEKSYGEDCSLTPKALWNAIDIFCLAHTLGWFGKALILRDYWFCWILSVAFELAEYSLQHQLPNFNECWWDHWLLDVLICNWLGTYLGMTTCKYFEVKAYTWRGFRQTRGIRSKGKRVLTQFSPHDWTTFKWEGTASLRNYLAVLGLLAAFLAAELNPFYLKSLLWMEPSHPFVIARLGGVFLCALPGVRELYQYVNDPRKTVRMGQHAWLLAATICTELLCIVKWSKGLFPEPFPTYVRVALSSGATILIIYPLVKFGVPQARRYLKRRTKVIKSKSQ